MNPTMVEVSRATSAAPTYSPPVELMDDNGQEYVLIDGGVTANNPATIGYYEALAEEHLLGADADFLVVSMGTGRPPEEVPSYEELWSRGWLSVGMGMLHVILDGTSEIADAMMQVIIRAKEPYSRYYRFNTDLRGCSLHMDDARPENLAALTRLGDEIVRERRADLEALPERLVLDPWTRSV